MVLGEVHANFGPDPSSSMGGEWRQTNKQTDRQTDAPFCFIYVYINGLARFAVTLSKNIWLATEVTWSKAEAVTLAKNCGTPVTSAKNVIGTGLF